MMSWCLESIRRRITSQDLVCSYLVTSKFPDTFETASDLTLVSSHTFCVLLSVRPSKDDSLHDGYEVHDVMRDQFEYHVNYVVMPQAVS